MAFPPEVDCESPEPVRREHPRAEIQEIYDAEWDRSGVRKCQDSGEHRRSARHTLNDCPVES